MDKKLLKKINNYFDSCKEKIFNRNDLEIILQDKENELGEFKTLNKFISNLKENTKMEEVRLNFPTRPIIKFTWGKVSFYDLLLSLKPLSYFSHQSALFFNKLIDKEPEIIYLNYEQPQKEYNNSQILQEDIDRAFKGRPRITRSVTQCYERKICLINGKYTNKLNVIKENINGSMVEFTNVERTLIDIVVRPQYSGGIRTLLQVYKTACGKYSMKNLIRTLKKLGHKYPYHQAIGYYATLAGNYDNSDLLKLKELGMKFNFYLAYNIPKKDLAYSKEWKIYHPKILF